MSTKKVEVNLVGLPPTATIVQEVLLEIEKDIAPIVWEWYNNHQNLSWNFSIPVLSGIFPWVHLTLKLSDLLPVLTIIFGPQQIVTTTTITTPTAPPSDPVPPTPALKPGEISTNGVSQTERAANYAAFIAANPKGGLWYDPWLSNDTNYTGTVITAGEAMPSDGLSGS